MIFGAASCQKDMANRKADCKVSFSVEIPNDLATKAQMSDGSTVDELVWEVYSGSSDIPVYEGIINTYSINSEGKKQFVLELDLVTNVKYDILCWAQKSDTGYYGTTNLKEVSTNYKVYSYTEGKYVPAPANDESRDAFYGSFLGFEPKPNGVASNERIELRRPFAQINFGTLKDDWDNAAPFIDGVGLKSKFVLKNVPNKLNVMDGSVSGSTEVTFDYALCPTSETEYTNNWISYKTLTYAWIGMNYIFAPKEKSTINEITGSFVHKGNNDKSALKKYVPNVPFCQNFKTNILGQIFTGGNTFNVIIEPGFETPHYADEPNYNIVDPIETVIEKGGTFALTSDMEISKSYTLRNGVKVVLNLNNYTLKYTGGDILFRVNANSFFTIKGNGKIEANGYIATTTATGGRITVEGGTFETTDATTFQANRGDVYINGGSFKSEPYNGTYYTLNKIDNAEGNIIVNAGRFYMYNPAKSNTEPGGPVSFLGSDRKLTVDGDWYVVSYIHD